jgi:hypothetical protein
VTDQIAFIASTAYFFDGDRGEAVTAKSRDGRRIAIYFDDATGSHWVCRLESWERYVDGELDYSLWSSTAESYGLERDDEGTFFGDLAPDMSHRDNWCATLLSARDRLMARAWAVRNRMTDGKGWAIQHYGSDIFSEQSGPVFRRAMAKIARIDARIKAVRS